MILRNSIFQEARKAAQNKLLCFINTDIILTGDFLKVIQSVRLPSFLLSGQRWDLNIKEPINFTNSAWQEKLRQQIKIDGKLHGLSAGDYFIFSRDVQPDMFPFSIKHTSVSDATTLPWQMQLWGCLTNARASRLIPCRYR
mgnify:CR=1 FL=1